MIMSIMIIFSLINQFLIALLSLIILTKKYISFHFNYLGFH